MATPNNLNTQLPMIGFPKKCVIKRTPSNCARFDRGRMKLLTRNGHDWSHC